jgi:hypothetical protein
LWCGQPVSTPVQNNASNSVVWNRFMGHPCLSAGRRLPVIDMKAAVE